MLSVQVTYNGYNAKAFGRNLYVHNGFKGQYMATGNWENLTYPYLIYVPAGKTVSIKSGNIVDATVTYEGDITPTYWQYYNSDGLINLGIPQDTRGSAIVIHAICKDGNSYDFKVLKTSTYSISTQINGKQLEINIENGATQLPLPLTDRSFLTTTDIPNDWTISIFNAITNQDMVTNTTLGTEVVDTSNWAQGVYVIRATNGNNTLTEKIIIK